VIEKSAVAIELASPEQIAELRGLLEVVNIPQATVDKWLTAANAESFEEMEASKVAACITLIRSKITPPAPIGDANAVHA
jgi:hypothetical protein